MKKNLSKIIFKVFGIGIGCLIIVITGIMVYQTIKNPHEIPSILGYKPMLLLSDYEEIKLKNGDFIIVKNTNPNNLNKNNIIIFRDEKDNITIDKISEITKVDEKRYFKVKEQDKFILENNIEGTYLFKIPLLGNILLFISKPIGFILLLLIILAIGLIWLYLSNKKEVYDTDEKKEFEEFKRRKNEKKC